MSRRFAAVAAVGAATVIAVAGCQSGNEGDGGGVGEGTDVGGGDILATQVLQRSADRSARVETFRATARVRGGTQSQQGSGGMSMDATGQYRMSPKLAFSQRVSNIGLGNQQMSGQMRQVLVDDTLYTKLPPGMPASSRNRPWVEASLDELGQQAGMNLRRLTRQARQLDVGNLTTLLTASKDARKVGNEEVGGVPTTRYTGTFSSERALKQLAPDQRKELSGQLEGMGTMTFDLWMDEQNLPRKLTMKPQDDQREMTISTQFRGFDQPVNIETPPENMTRDIDEVGGNMMPGGSGD